MNITSFIAFYCLPSLKFCHNPLCLIDTLMKVTLTDGYCIAGQFGYVIALQQEYVVLRVVLGQTESLMGMSLLIEVSDEGAGVIPVHASCTEYYPASVTAPCVIGVHIVGVGLGEGIDTVSLQVFDVEVARFVPDVELAIFAFGVEQVTTVGTYTGEGGTAVATGAVNHQFGWTKFASLSVVGHPSYVVVEFVVIGNTTYGFYAVGYDFVTNRFLGCAIVEPFSIG